MTPTELLHEYDAQVRASFAARVPARWTASADGPLTRCVTGRGGFAMSATDLSVLSRGERAALVDRTVAFYAGLGRRFEWKTFDHDGDGLVDLLLERGFVPEEHEALVLGSAVDLAGELAGDLVGDLAGPALAPGLTMRSVRDRVDLDRVEALENAVWDGAMDGIADDLEGRVAAEPPTTVLVVEDGDTVVSAAWLEPLTGTSFAGLWGGSTLAAYRGRGIYRALVARRARLALDLGFTLLQVDASDDSRPILERLGLHTVGGTTPYIWTPAG